ncbi:MAG TPA: hypothetical protein VM533_17515 [Fimbriiglobus sp.]|jgi:hypothetical protein|nr:hypothetical protein [Fimbriiglobus sp.]
MRTGRLTDDWGESFVLDTNRYTFLRATGADTFGPGEQSSSPV